EQKSFRDGVYPDSTYSGTRDTYIVGSPTPKTNANFGTRSLK
ncbi:unnamed protein product, partial [marine sediment metagenome]